MRTLQKTPVRKASGKKERECQVLLALVELYIRTEKPIGSNTLRDLKLQQFSSATLRNYFTSLENEGYLHQLHSSGGRIPTQKAYRVYAEEALRPSQTKERPPLKKQDQELLQQLRTPDSAEVSELLERGAELLSRLTRRAVFLSAPKFDHDLIADLKLVAIDQNRCLCVILTSFGLVKTELLHTEEKLHAFSAKRIEAYFHWRLTGQDPPAEISESEQEIANRFYNEILVRYIVGYSNFSEEEIYRTGLSQLLHYPDYAAETGKLASCLSLFENPHKMRLLLRECTKLRELKYWIGDQLPLETPGANECAVLAVPYYVGPRAVGAIGLLGPISAPYPALFELLKQFSEALSEGLTNRIYRFGITYRQPNNRLASIEQEKTLLLEDKRG